MESGLYGVSGLPGGNNTNNWKRDADYGHLDVHPPYVPELAASRALADRVPGRPLPDSLKHPNHLRLLVSTLSTPEILQLLAKWKVRHPSDIPLSCNVPIQKKDLIDMVVQCEGALNEVVRLTSARGVRSDTIKSMWDPTIKKQERLKVIGTRAKTPCYQTQLNAASQMMISQRGLPPVGVQGVCLQGSPTSRDGLRSGARTAEPGMCSSRRRASSPIQAFGAGSLSPVREAWRASSGAGLQGSPTGKNGLRSGARTAEPGKRPSRRRASSPAQAFGAGSLSPVREAWRASSAGPHLSGAVTPFQKVSGVASMEGSGLSGALLQGSPDDTRKSAKAGLAGASEVLSDPGRAGLKQHGTGKGDALRRSERQAEKRSRKRDVQGAGEPAGGGSLNSWAKAEKPEWGGAKGASGKVGGSGLKGARGSRRTMDKQAMKERFAGLRLELDETMRAREEEMLELARRGILASSLDADMCFPIMKGTCTEVEIVKRSLHAFSGYNYQKRNNLIRGLAVDDALSQLTHTISPSTLSLCL